MKTELKNDVAQLTDNEIDQVGGGTLYEPAGVAFVWRLMKAYPQFTPIWTSMLSMMKW